MIEIQPITQLNASAFKAICLRALREAPYAFGSTYEKESQFADSEWQTGVERMNGQRGVGFIAVDGEEACGIVGSFLDQHDPARAHLISMWTAPSYRQQGIGRMLVKAVLDWAGTRNVHTLLLMVTSNKRTRYPFLPAVRIHQNRTNRAIPE